LNVKCNNKTKWPSRDANPFISQASTVKAKFHYAVLVADKS